MLMPMLSGKRVKLMKDSTIAKSSRSIKVDYLARVEGEGSLYIKFKDKKVSDVKLKIFEPPRFFEAFLRDRKYMEAPDITARICGICPVAYQMSSVHAMEKILDIKITPQLRDLRRLLYCGEWIESHLLHMFLLHVPDFLGYQDSIQLAKDYPDIVKTALKIKKVGNDIVNLIGGREIHPINVRVGGFYRLPEMKELDILFQDIEWALANSLILMDVLKLLEYPVLERDYEFVSLRYNPEKETGLKPEYPFNEGRLVSNKGLDISIEEYEHHFTEIHEKHSNALHSVHNKFGSYHVGPISRFNLNYDFLPESVKKVAAELNIMPPVVNPFMSLKVRFVESVYALQEAKRIIENYRKPESPFIHAEVKAGVGCACTEAPRGILYHRYKIDEKGLIREAKIVPPTSQNLSTIEEDLREFAQNNQSLSDEKLTWKCEQTVRNYDPCISCATHFLNLTVERI